MAKKKEIKIVDLNQHNIFVEPEKNESSHTEEQKEFIFYKGTSSIILASVAGSGKTFATIERVKFLLESGVEPSRILLISFTNAATKEIIKRLNREDVAVSTIHSFCAKVLTRLKKGKAIVSFFDFINWYKNTQKPSKNSPYEDIEDFNDTVENLYEEFSFYESKIAAYKLQKADNIGMLKAPLFYALYQQFLFETKSRDFSDMLIEVRNLFQEDRNLSLFKNKYDHIFLDEYQDTSSIQMQILLYLNAKQYYLCGDVFQAIYGYSGTSCKKIEEMLKTRRKTLQMNLTKNFRSDKLIIENSNKFSDLIAVPNSVDEGTVNRNIIYTMDQFLEILNTTKGEIAVLVRTNAVIRKLEWELLKRKVPIRYFNYLTKDDIGNYNKDNINFSLQQKLDSIKQYFDNSIPALLSFIKANENSRRFITSIHKSKGREFETCIVVNSIDYDVLEENDILDKLSTKQLKKISFNPADEEDTEAKCVHYVAVSRSKHNLYYMVYDLI